MDDIEWPDSFLLTMRVQVSWRRKRCYNPCLHVVLSIHHILDYWLIGTVADVAVSCVAVVGDRWIARPWIVEAFGADEAYE